MINCSEGQTSDNLFRVPMEPYFPEPYGDDCYRNVLSFDIVGGFVFTIVSLLFIVHLVTFAVFHKRAKLITAALVLQTIVLATMMGAILVSFFLPRYFFVAWMVFMLFLAQLSVSWLYLGYHSMVQTIRKVEIRNFSMADLLGGRIVVQSFKILLVVSAVVSGTGLIGIAASIYPLNGAPVDNRNATIFFRLFCGGLAANVAVFMICMYRVFTRFIKMIEFSLQNNSLIRANETSSGKSLSKEEELKDLVNRMRRGRNLMLACSPGGVGMWIVQASVLPLFWYIVFFHFLNAAVGCFAVWYSLVSVDKKRQILTRLGLAKFNGTGTSRQPDASMSPHHVGEQTSYASG